MTATAADVVRFLNTVPANTRVTIRINGMEGDINSLVRTEQRNPETDDLDIIGPVVLSGNYYGV